MYAVIKTGGKQQRVKTGDVIEVELMTGADETVTFHPLLVVDDDGKAHAGTEAQKAVVTARPMGEKKGDKVRVLRYRPKTGYSKRAGHRQMLTLLEIEDVSLGAPTKKPAAKKKAAPKKAAATVADQPADTTDASTEEPGTATDEEPAMDEEPAANTEEPAADAGTE